MAAELDTRDIIEAIKDGHERQERAMGVVSSNLQGLAEAVAKGFARGSSTSSSQPLILLAAMAAILFGLMSPLYQRFAEQDAKASRIEARMDTKTDRERTDAAESAEVREALKALESRLQGAIDLMDIEHGILARSADGTETAVLGLSMSATELRERIRALERIVEISPQERPRPGSG